jgi:hypothetical protein
MTENRKKPWTLSALVGAFVLTEAAALLAHVVMWCERRAMYQASHCQLGAPRRTIDSRWGRLARWLNPYSQRWFAAGMRIADRRDRSGIEGTR